jgi:Protein of unknown function (DUF2523)
MSDITKWFTDLIASIASWCLDILSALFGPIWDLLTDMVCKVVDVTLSFVITTLNAVDLSGIDVSGWGSLPADLINVLGLIGVGQASAIIASAIGVRLILQLIPFVRLGS